LSFTTTHDRPRAVTALQQHMCDKGHCKVRFEDEDEEEMHEFYDFTLDISLEDGQVQERALVATCV
jgi:hypothetical protein